MLPQFLMALTLITGGAFANEGGHKCIEEKGAKQCIEGMLEQKTNVPLTQKLYTKTVNE